MFGKLFIIIVAFKCTSGESFSFADWRSASDLITNLPGLSHMPNFKMFSGYLDASGDKHLHYWFNECTDPDSDILILWFNGGPGCSSLDGLLVENGPFHFNSDGSLIENEYSWNKLGHTLYIEAPVGVGFSYASHYDEVYDDDKTAQDNVQALKDFFLKFPSMQGKEIYISGESYAGVYIPMLVKYLIKDKTMIDDVKGVLIGNGLLDAAINEQSMVYFAYYHGLIGPTLWNELLTYCCPGEIHCQFKSIFNENCILKLSRVSHIVSSNGLNPYNLYANCASESQNLLLKSPFPFNFLTQNQNVLQMENYKKDYGWLSSNKLNLVPPCSNASLITRYLNRQDVQQAIHVLPRTWEICNGTVLKNFNKKYTDMTEVIREIVQVQDDIRFLFYFGDTDMACNHLGGEWFVDQLGYEITTPRRRWTIHNPSLQVAGFYKDYIRRITFATVKGAGHMVPTDKPQEGYEMVQRFLDEAPL